MQNHYFFCSFRLLACSLFCFATTFAVAQTNSSRPLTRIITERLNNRALFETYRPFNPAQESNFASRSDIQSYLRDGIIVETNTKDLHAIMAFRDEDIRISLPLPNGENMALLLFKAQVLTDNFQLTAHSERGEQDQPYTPGAYYRGIVENDPNSIAAISFFDNGEVIGMISNDRGNYVVGQLNDNSGKYIIYNDRDLLVANPFVCEVQDESIRRPIPDPMPEAQLRSGICGKLVRAYLECDFELYTNKGSNLTTTTNYATGMYNNVATLYQNESISTQTSQIYVWTTADSYPASDANAILGAFGALRQDSFNGDIAHLISGVNSGGGYSGLAWLDVLCSTYWAAQQSGRFAYSNIALSYSAVPTYSWTVGCVTHEMGHNLGSPHTHSCCWTGGALDNCVAVESCGGTCSPGPAPVNGGTIMSYCHITAAGVNFNNGFGTQPGNLIRNNVNTASCLPGDIAPTATYNNTPVSGLAVSFTATGTGTNNTYTWNFGDPTSGTNNTTTGASPSHTFTAAGTYTVELTVTNDCGSDTESQTVIVTNYTPPVVCSGAQNTTTCTGTITDGSTGNYANNKTCTWLIAPTGASSVTLTFSMFDTEAGYDFVNVYNGSSATAPLLGSYSGTNLPPTLVATSGQMFVRFTTDQSIVGDGFSANYSCTTPTPAGNRLQAKVFLEGVYNTATGTMSSGLGTSLPIAQPYNAAPWSYNGTESVGSTNTNMIDWVLIELRNATDPTTIVARKAGMLYADGTVRHTDGVQGVDFGTLAGSYYVTIRHRNHLPVISAITVALPNTTPYDFTTSAAQSQGGIEQLRDINGVQVLRAGDFDSDGALTYNDFNRAVSQGLAGSTNYVTGDANLDKSINLTDYGLYVNNLGIMGIPLLRY